VAMQEAAPRRLLGQSESTTPAPLRGPCRVLSSHLRQRRVSLPRNVPTPSGLMTPAPSQKDLLGVSLVPEITVQSVPDVTSPPSIDQKVPSVFHPVPFRFIFDPPSDPASVSALARAYPDLLGYHMWSSWDRLTAVPTSGPAGSEENDDSDFGWDFSGLSDPCETSCPHVTTTSPTAPMMTTASVTRVATQVVSVSTSIRGSQRRQPPRHAAR
jgi:hypothetical protein